MENKLTNKTWVIIGIAVVVIAAILVYAFYFESPKPSSSSGKISYAPSGQTVASFPTDLILGTSPQTQESYSINYATSTNQSTATFVTSGSLSDSMVALFDSYQLYFSNPANGWQITGRTMTVPTVRGVTATKGMSVANVTIIQQSATSSKVTVSYVDAQ